MPKIKLTKGELKRQKDLLKQFERYLPTLQLKKQQLQMELLRQHILLDEKTKAAAECRESILAWAGLLSDKEVDLKALLVADKAVCASRNIAGVDIPVFERLEFKKIEYDLFMTPLWVDLGTEALKALASLREEMRTLERGIEVLRDELRVTAQRVNLFEKVKIPESEEAIRRIKIYIGDQMTNAVGRSKMAKSKIEAAVLAESAGVLI